MISTSSVIRFLASSPAALRLALLPGRGALLGSFLLALGLMGFGSSVLVAQTAAAPATASAATAPAPKPVHPHKRKAAAQAKTENVQAAAVAAAPVTPAQPEAPHWPVNDKPTPATITWDSQGLRVAAENSSLAQILQDVATATGATIEGFDDDRRIYGVYGPGQTREILSQLLQGSGYNVVMVGDLGQGAPRQILLTLRAEAKAAKAADKKASGGDEDDDDDQPQQANAQPAPPQPAQPPMRTPAQFPQDAQRRRQLGNGQSDTPQ
jgi:hypothetical protein